MIGSKLCCILDLLWPRKPINLHFVENENRSFVMCSDRGSTIQQYINFIEHSRILIRTENEK